MQLPNNQILIYQNADGNIKIDVRLEEETVWLTEAQIAELFGKGRSTITEHIQNIFDEKIGRNSGMSEFPTYHYSWCYRREKTRRFE